MPVKPHRPGGEYARPPVLPDEPQRLETLRSYDVLDTPEEQAYHDLTLLASHICETPIAMVSLVDANRQWFKARLGLTMSETPRDVAFCAHAIAGTETMVVPDALHDQRFAFNPLVIGEPQIRFYAGTPLRAPSGHALGTLCVIDRVPRQLSEPQRAALEALSRQVMAQLELRRKLAEVERLTRVPRYCGKCGEPVG
jgi:GAF domain-containing protein